MRAVLTVMKKELWETLRDPMVLIMSLGFPILFFPLIIWGTLQMVSLSSGIAEAEPPRVYVQGSAAPGPGGVVDALHEAPALPTQGSEADLQAGDLDLMADVELVGSMVQITLHHNSTLPRSKRAVQWAEEQLEEVRSAREKELAEAAGISADALAVWKIKSEDVALASSRMVSILAQSMPMILVVMLLIATVSPAVDIFVGERERGTLETSMVTTTSRWPLILGKTLAASLIGIVGVAGNLVAGGITLIHTLSSMGAAEQASIPLSAGPMVLVLLPLAAGAALAAALTFLVIIPARTFKQAQSLSSFVIIGVMGVVYSTAPEDAAPETWMALLPGPNLLHSLSEALRGTLAADFALIAAGTNLILAAILLHAAHRIMQHEGYLFGPENSGWRDAVRSLLPQRWSHR